MQLEALGWSESFANPFEALKGQQPDLAPARVSAAQREHYRLMSETGVLVHPGYFFDLRGGTFLVVSLLPEPAVFAEASRRMVGHLGT